MFQLLRQCHGEAHDTFNFPVHAAWNTGEWLQMITLWTGMIHPSQVNSKSVNSPFSRALSSELGFLVSRRPEVWLYLTMCFAALVEIIAVWLEDTVYQQNEFRSVAKVIPPMGDLRQHLLTLAIYYYLWSSFHAWLSPAASSTTEKSNMRWFVRLGSLRLVNDYLLGIRKINSLSAGDSKPKASFTCSISSILCNNLDLARRNITMNR